MKMYVQLTFYKGNVSRKAMIRKKQSQHMLRPNSYGNVQTHPFQAFIEIFFSSI